MDVVLLYSYNGWVHEHTVLYCPVRATHAVSKKRERGILYFAYISAGLRRERVLTDQVQYGCS